MKKILSLILCLIMVFSSIPAFALVSSAESGGVYIGNVELKNGEYLLKGETETKTFTELVEEGYDFESGEFAVLLSDQLILNNFSYEGAGYGETGERKAVIRVTNIEILLVGENEITCTTENGVGIYCKGYLDFSFDGSIDITADYCIMISDDTDDEYSPQYAQSDVDVCLNVTSSEGIGLAVGSEVKGAYVDLYSGSLTVNGNGSNSGIEIVSPEGDNAMFVNCVADVVIGECDFGIKAKRVSVDGGSVICNVKDCGIYAQGSEVTLSDAYIDITVSSASGNCIRSDITTLNLKTMYVDFGGGAEKMYVAYPRTYVQIGDVYLYDGQYLESEGYKSSESKPSGTRGYAYYTTDGWGGHLELNNFEMSDMASYVWGRSGYFEGDESCIYTPYNLEIVLKGSNMLNPDNYHNGIALYGSLTVSGDGTLDIGKENEDTYGILMMSDYATDDIELLVEGGNVNIYSEDSVILYDFGYNKDSAVTFNEGKWFLRNMYVSAPDESTAAIVINDGELKISTGERESFIPIETYGGVTTGFIQNGGTVEIEVYDAVYAVDVYKINDDLNGAFEIYGGSFSVKSLKGEAIDTTSSEFPIIGNGMAIVQGEWDSAFIKIAEDPDNPPAISGKLGDVNNDGEINQYDYILVKRHYFETRILTDDEAARADVNKDAKVDQFDYILIARHYFGTYVIG